jgi:ubiquinone biosynthesis monooxygenase Coq7
VRRYNLLDKIVMQIDGAVNTVLASQFQSRSNPADGLDEAPLSSSEQRKSQGYMRVNHTGEVCAQALYRGQLAFAKDDVTRDMLEKAAVEETDHLAWTHQRLQELDTHRSYLNFFWYINSFFMGMLASKIGDKWSLGFVEETERQVSEHLDDHLDGIAKDDLRSRAIISKMRDDEAEHGACANAAGAAQLPGLVIKLMTLHAGFMKKIVYFI